MIMNHLLQRVQTLGLTGLLLATASLALAQDPAAATRPAPKGASTSLQSAQKIPPSAPAQPGSVYEKLGVRTGDVIRSVNGQPINNMDEVMKLYQQLGGIDRVGSVAIEVTRGGRTESLQYNIE